MLSSYNVSGQKSWPFFHATDPSAGRTVVNYPRLRLAKKRGLLGEYLGAGFLLHQPLPSALASGLTQFPQA